MAQQVDIYDDNFSEDSFSESVQEMTGGQNKKKQSHDDELIITKEDTLSQKSDEISDEEEDDVSSEGSDASDVSGGSTIDQLSRDPLFLVLSQYLSNKDGNIVDALDKINKSLKKIIHIMKKTSNK